MVPYLYNVPRRFPKGAAEHLKHTDKSWELIEWAEMDASLDTVKRKDILQSVVHKGDVVDVKYEDESSPALILKLNDGVKLVWRQQGGDYKDKCVLPTVKHVGGSVMVWGCMSAAGTGELQFIEGTMNANMYCDILKQSMNPSLRRLGRRAVFQHDNDPKHTSKTTTALLKKLRVKVKT
ncbi:hypothetical protein IRJ41_013509 [Triplophysa rosa]|uniref:Transposable element n=1 Tax=Triplophysa rosa TaxID=992332 RepID=A0A9W7TEY5_TRIRA|nr:hypothetical protein IRJ41_013509 [Triplophysa rosa]